MFKKYFPALFYACILAISGFIWVLSIIAWNTPNNVLNHMGFNMAVIILGGMGITTMLGLLVLAHRQNAPRKSLFWIATILTFGYPALHISVFAIFFFMVVFGGLRV